MPATKSKSKDKPSCTVPAAELRAALTWLRGCTKPKGVKPILANVLLKAAGDTLKLSTTDLDGFCTATLIGTVEDGPFSATVNADLLFQNVKLERGESVAFHYHGDTVSVEGEGGKLVMNATSGADFPEFPPPVGDEHYKIMSGVLLDTHKLVSGIIPDEDDPKRRFQFRGILTAVKDCKLILQSTNGSAFVMATGNAPFQVTPSERIRQTIVSDDAFRLIAAATREDREADVSVWLEKNAVHFRTDKASVSYRLLEGRFPDAIKWIKESHETEASIQTSAGKLQDAIARVALVDDMIDFEADEVTEELLLQASKDGSSAQAAISVLPSCISGDGMVRLDANYLKAGIRGLDADSDLTIFLGGKTPTKIESVGGEFLFAMAPLIEKDLRSSPPVSSKPAPDAPPQPSEEPVSEDSEA